MLNCIKESLSKILNLQENYADSRVDRRKGVGGTQEFFTPYELVCKMCDKVPKEKWLDPDTLFLEPCFGDGAFIVEILRRRIQDYNINWKQTLETTFGVELMPDNVEQCHNRVIRLLQELKVPDFDEKAARQIMQENLVCSDFFKWDFENWKPLPSNESIELF